jgi:hypothetical protein
VECRFLGTSKYDHKQDGDIRAMRSEGGSGSGSLGAVGGDATPVDDGGPESALEGSAEKLAHFRPVRLRKAADVVVDILVDAIRNGLYIPGDKLPRERDLAAHLEVSRTTGKRHRSCSAPES